MPGHSDVGFRTQGFNGRKVDSRLGIGTGLGTRKDTAVQGARATIAATYAGPLEDWMEAKGGHGDGMGREMRMGMEMAQGWGGSTAVLTYLRECCL